MQLDHIELGPPGRIFLQVEEHDALEPGQRRELARPHRPHAIVLVQGVARPREADFEAAPPAHTGLDNLPPAVDLGGVDLDIGARSRDRVEGGSEQAWDAEQGSVAIEFREWLPRGDQVIDPRGAGQQPQQCRLAFQDDRAAAAGDHRRVADELDCVTEALVGVQQNALAVER